MMRYKVRVRLESGNGRTAWVRRNENGNLTFGSMYAQSETSAAECSYEELVMLRAVSEIKIEEVLEVS